MVVVLVMVVVKVVVGVMVVDAVVVEVMVMVMVVVWVGVSRENNGTAHDENMTPSPASAPEARCWATGPVLKEGQGGARSEVKHPRPGLNDTARQGHPRPGTARHAAKKNTAPHGNGTQRDTAPHGRGGGAPNRARHSTSTAHPRHGKRGGAAERTRSGRVACLSINTARSQDRHN